jgi:hypothetical protein
MAAEAWDLNPVTEAIQRSANRNKDNIVKEMIRRRSESDKHKGLLAQIAAKLNGQPEESFDHLLNGTVLQARELECLYVLDRYGFQVSRTITMQFMRGRTRGILFQPALRGTDHSMKDYFYSLVDAGLARFITEPYISLASGNLCRTLSCTFQGQAEKDYILCMDVKCE